MRTTSPDGAPQEECREERLSTDAPLVLATADGRIVRPFDPSVSLARASAATTKRMFGIPLLIGGLGGGVTGVAGYAVVRNSGYDPGVGYLLVPLISGVVMTVLGTALLGSADSDLDGSND